jgi:FixJ family two-component response regulator
MDEEATVFVVEDEEPVAKAVANAVKVIGLKPEVYSSAEGFLGSYDSSRFGCLVLDYKLSGTNGLELQRELNSLGSLLPVVMISGHADVRVAVEAMQNGAVTLLEKPFQMTRLHGAIREALDVAVRRRQKSAERDAAKATIDRLTQKEREVLYLVCQGHTNKDIAAQLGLSLRAIEDRRARMMKKLDVETLAELLTVCRKAEG